MQALTYLQRALLVHDLQTLNATEWESCFNKVQRPQATVTICFEYGLECSFFKKIGGMKYVKENPCIDFRRLFMSVFVCLQVLFPLLTKLLDNISPADVGGMEETRMRACTLLSKVQSSTLQHSLLTGETTFMKPLKSA